MGQLLAVDAEGRYSQDVEEADLRNPSHEHNGRFLTPLSIALYQALRMIFAHYNQTGARFGIPIDAYLIKWNDHLPVSFQTDIGNFQTVKRVLNSSHYAGLIETMDAARSIASFPIVALIGYYHAKNIASDLRTFDRFKVDYIERHVTPESDRKVCESLAGIIPNNDIANAGVMAMVSSTYAAEQYIKAHVDGKQEEV